LGRATLIVFFLLQHLAISAQPSAAVPTWKIYYDSAQIFWGTDWQKSVLLLSRAEKSALNDLGIYDANYLTIINDLGIAYSKIQDYPNAEKLLQQKLTLETELHGTPSEPVFTAMLNLAAVYSGQGNAEKAKALYKKILTMAEPAEYEDIFLSSATKLELLYEHQDALEDAIKLLNDLREKYNANQKAQYEILLSLGRVERKLRKYSASGMILENLIHELQDSTDPEVNLRYIDCLEESGLLYAETGAYAQAEKNFLKCLNLLRTEYPGETVRLIEALNNTASLYERLGIYDKAIAYFQEAINLNDRLPIRNTIAAITLQSNIAGIHLKQSNIQIAIGIYEEILEALPKLVAQSDPFYITVLNNLATAYRKNNEYNKATTTVTLAYHLIQNQNVEHEDLAATVMNNMAVLLTAKGEPEKAIAFYEQAYAIKRRLFGDQSVLLMDLAGNMAVVYWALHKPESAIPLFQKSIELSIRQIRYIFPNLSEGEQIQFYKKLKEDFERFGSVAIQAAASHPNLLTQVFDNQVIIKSLLFFTQQRKQNIILEKHDTVLNAQYALLKAKREQLGYFYQLSLKALGRAEYTSSDLEEEIDALEKSISLKTSETVAEKMMNSDIHWSDVRRNIQSDEALIEIMRFRKYDLKTFISENTERVSFGFTDSIYYAALITTQESTRNPQLILMKDGKNMETRFLSYYRNALAFDVPDENSYKQYWKPVESAVANKSRILFSGDGVYHRINLNTLRASQNADFLIQRFDIHYLLNPAQFMERKLINFGEKKAVLVGNPDFNGPAGENDVHTQEKQQVFLSLAGTQVEISDINILLKNNGWKPNVFVKQQATEYNLKNIQSPNILHIATHGFFSADKVKLNTTVKQDFLFYAGLVLAGANKSLRGDNEPNGDGILTAYEVMNLNLTSTNLVVLSACETGLGKIENGEGVYGLQRSFLQAGARNIVISLWKVNDLETKDLMIRFYQYLFENKSPRDALKQAQLDQLKKTSDPKDWGGFILVGLD